MKPTTLLFALATVLLAVSTTAWPVRYPHFPINPLLPPHFHPYPPHGGAAPSSSRPAPHWPYLPPVADMTKCAHAVHGSDKLACFKLSYDAGKCCSHVRGMADACSSVPYFNSPFFQGIVNHVCDGASASSPSPAPTS